MSNNTVANTTTCHCPYRRATDLLQRLAPGKMRIGFFLGAGCALAVRVQDGEKTKPLIPEIAGLTEQVKKVLDSNGEIKAVAQSAWERVIGRGIPTPTVEDVLSHIRTLQSLCSTAPPGVCGNSVIDGFADSLFTKLDQAICEEVRKIVSKTLPSIDTPYHVLAKWIQAIARDKPVEIFTTNYDLLLEQALEEQRMPYFDGFIGSNRRTNGVTH